MTTLLIKCVKDTEGWWTEGAIYEAYRIAYGFVMLGDDQPDSQYWTASPVEYRVDGSIIYEVGGLYGEAIFEETAQ